MTTMPVLPAATMALPPAPLDPTHVVCDAPLVAAVDLVEDAVRTVGAWEREPGNHRCPGRRAVRGPARPGVGAGRGRPEARAGSGRRRGPDRWRLDHPDRARDPPPRATCCRSPDPPPGFGTGQVPGRVAASARSRALVEHGSSTGRARSSGLEHGSSAGRRGGQGPVPPARGGTEPFWRSADAGPGREGGVLPGGHPTGRLPRHPPVQHADRPSPSCGRSARLHACRSPRSWSRVATWTSCACAGWRAVLVARLSDRRPPADRARASARHRPPGRGVRAPARPNQGRGHPP